MLSGSRTDEDIVLHDEASIVTNNQGTGGSTDAWIRLLSQRTLSTNLPRGSVDVYDMGWGAADWNDLTDDNGDLVLVDVGPTTEHKRIVEWMDGDGVVHQENAQITVSITSSWGVYSKTIDAPGTTAATVNVDLPYVDVLAVSPEYKPSRREPKRVRYGDGHQHKARGERRQHLVLPRRRRCRHHQPRRGSPAGRNKGRSLHMVRLHRWCRIASTVRRSCPPPSTTSLMRW